MGRYEPSRASYKDWELTLNSAFQALNASQRATEVSSDSWAEEALKCLQERYILAYIIIIIITLLDSHLFKP